MLRVVFYQVLDPGTADPAGWAVAIGERAAARSWRTEPMWLATDDARGLFEMEYLRHVRLEADREVVGAGFVRPGGDETDALAALFILVELTREFQGRAEWRDDGNPIRKQRWLVLNRGEPAGRQSLDELMVARPVQKRLPGGTITFYPPRYRGATLPGPSGPPGSWSFSLEGLRAEAGSFLEAEAEAMRMYRSLSAIV
ncbi:MAG TPA: hypothetical protein VNN74_10500 [Candidatus Micrarchaeia archaeon]|nr:hypothetical protein [Candidatus Micrarchaeia archaeon]